MPFTALVPASIPILAAGKPKLNGFDLKREPTLKPAPAPVSAIPAPNPALGINKSFALPIIPKFCEKGLYALAALNPL